MSSARIDPSLAEALRDAASASKPLNVFLKVDLPKGGTSVVERVEELSKDSQVRPKVQYRELDRTLHVLAPGAFVKTLVEQPWVLAASEAPRFDSALIPPVNKKDVDPSAIDRPLRKKKATSPGRGGSQPGRRRGRS